MDQAASPVAVLAYLRGLGIQLHIDDFGTGYSSLSTLHQFPISTLKIDRSFVKRLGPSGEHGEMIKAIVTLAHNLRLEVIAEGVETAAQRDYLCSLDCDFGQGYLFSKAVDAQKATALLTKSRLLDRNGPLAIAPPYVDN